MLSWPQQLAVYEDARVATTRSRATAARAVVACLALYAGYCIVTRPIEPILLPDSYRYLDASPDRSLGYVAFLAVVGANAATILQPVIFAAALAWLVLEVLAATNAAPLAFAIVVAAILTPELTTLHRSILTESLFMAATLLFLAALGRHLRKGTWHFAAAASLIAGAAATVRSAGLGLVPALILGVVVTSRRVPSRAGRTLAAAVIPIFVIAAGERIAKQAVFGDRATSLMGPHLFAKAALIDAPPSTHRSTPLEATLDGNLTAAYAPIREIVGNAPSGAAIVLLLYYESCLQGPCTRSLLPPQTPPGAALDDQLLKAALARFRRAPIGFVALVMRDYFSLWMPFKQQQPAIARDLNAYAAAHRPMPFQAMTFAVPLDQPVIFHATPAVRYVYPIVVLIGIVTGAIAIAGSVMALRGRLAPAALQIACVSALAAHGQLLFSATFAAGISRFMIAAWPTVAVSGLATIAWVVGVIRDRSVTVSS